MMDLVLVQVILEVQLVALAQLVLLDLLDPGAGPSLLVLPDQLVLLVRLVMMVQLVLPALPVLLVALAQLVLLVQPALLVAPDQLAELVQLDQPDLQDQQGLVHHH